MICDIIYHVVTGFSEEAGKEQPNLIHSDETCRKLSDWQISPCCTDVNSWWRRWVTLDVIALFERSIGTLPSSPFLPPPPSPSLSLFLYRFLSPFSLWFIYLCCRGPPPPPHALCFSLFTEPDSMLVLERHQHISFLSPPTRACRRWPVWIISRLF